MIASLRRAALARLATVEDLIRVLMKPRNGDRWTGEDRAFLRRQFRGIAPWTPLFFLLLLPGGFLSLGAFVWLLDRRRRSAPLPGGQRSTDPE